MCALVCNGHAPTPLPLTNNQRAGNRAAMSHSFKVIVIGDHYSGKTCIGKRLCYDMYDEKVLPTVGNDILNKKLRVGSEEVEVRSYIATLLLSIYN